LLPEGLEGVEEVFTLPLALEAVVQAGIKRFLELLVLVRRTQLRWVPEGLLVQMDQPLHSTQIHQLEVAGVLHPMLMPLLLVAQVEAQHLFIPPALQEPPGRAIKEVMAEVFLRAIAATLAEAVVGLVLLE
jgi:hypothetical protein